MANNPRWDEVSARANASRASQAGREQAALAREALAVLQTQTGPHVPRWIQALQHRIEHPEATLSALSQSMSPPLTKHAYAALLRRALRGNLADELFPVREALAVLQTQSGPHVARWIQVLQHRINYPEATLSALSQSMSPPLTQHAYAGLLRRALRGAQHLAEEPSSEREED